VDLFVGLTGLAAAAGTLGILHPVLLPLLAMAAIPEGWASARAARMRYLAMYNLSASMRRKWILTDLMASRQTAAEIRSSGMRSFLLAQYQRIARSEQDIQVRLARQQTLTRLVGQAMAGVAVGGSTSRWDSFSPLAGCRSRSPPRPFSPSAPAGPRCASSSRPRSSGWL
jgi:ATP-binding cassette subfamily B protein